MASGNTISKNPVLNPDQDFARLFEAGRNYITELGSALWTDLNEHDPGITILEALCFAITELGYRTSLPMEDLLTDADGHIRFDEQTLFSPKKILTQSPLTTDDYRKLLIDVDGISNAWLMHHSHYKTENSIIQAGEVAVFADCLNDVLISSPPGTCHPVYLKGLYKVLLDLDNDPQLGDLNNSEVDLQNPASSSFAASVATLNIVFPDGLDKQNHALLLAEVDNTYSSLYFSSPPAITQVINSSVWKVPLVITLQTSPPSSPPYFPIPVASPPCSPPLFSPPSFSPLLCSPPQDINPLNITVTVSVDVQPSGQAIGTADIAEFFSDPAFCAAVLNIYLLKFQKTHKIIQTAIRRLNCNRNLCEDFNSVETIKDEEIGFCCDIDVAPGTDMAEVQASVFYAVDQYLDPPVNFYLLGEMLAKKYTVDEIFDGPRLDHGFIDTAELEKSVLPGVIYTSEIISRIMSVSGVLAVRNFLMTAYDADGNAINCCSDKTWCLNLLPWHKPVLSPSKSNITFYKNKFPYRADQAVINVLLQQMMAVEERNKLTSYAADIPSPPGTFFPLDNYTSVEYLFPVAYGIGNTVLPATVTNLQLAQARQLKAYLLFYDQLLSDFLTQLKNAKELFSTNNIIQTYYARFISGIYDINNIYSNEGPDTLQALLSTQNSSIVPPDAWQWLYESKETFTERRNRFLNHLMARFSESFNDYVAMMYTLDYETQQETKTDPVNLINTKIKFLKGYPEISYNRDRAFNYLPEINVLQQNSPPGEEFITDTTKLWNTDNVSGLEEKLCLLGGFTDDPADATFSPPKAGMKSYFRRKLSGMGNYQIIPDPLISPAGPFQFAYNAGGIQIISTKTYSPSDLTNVLPADLLQFLNYVLAKDHYSIVKINPSPPSNPWQILVLDDDGNTVAQTTPNTFSTKKAASAAVPDFIAEFNKECDIEGLHLIEHILLRPRDATFEFAPVNFRDCNGFCTEDDPYSFRITVVMPYWPPHLNSLDFRTYFEQIVRKEVPAHCMVKICWVDEVSMARFETAYKHWIYAHARFKADHCCINIFKEANDNLINILYKLYNQYPVATLFDCNESQTNPVMLGKTALGSFNS